MHHVVDEVVPRAGPVLDDEQAPCPDPEFLDEQDAEVYFDFLDWEPACDEHLFDEPVAESLSESEAPFDFPSDWRRIASVACGDANLPAAYSPGWDWKPVSPFPTSRHDCTWDRVARRDERVFFAEAPRACRRRRICHLAPETCTGHHRMRRAVKRSGLLVLRFHLKALFLWAARGRVVDVSTFHYVNPRERRASGAGCWDMLCRTLRLRLLMVFYSGLCVVDGFCTCC